MEERSEIRHEYVGGVLYAMVGGSDHHHRIAGNIYISFSMKARESGCRVYIADMRFQIDDVYYYPDVMVAWEPPETENPLWRTNPCVVVEVLSPSTETIDRREKLLAYRAVSSVQTDRASRYTARRAVLPQRARAMGTGRPRPRWLHPDSLPRDTPDARGDLPGPDLICAPFVRSPEAASASPCSPRTTGEYSMPTLVFLVISSLSRNLSFDTPRISRMARRGCEHGSSKLPR